MALWERLQLPGPAGHRQLFLKDWLLYWGLQSCLFLGTGVWLSLTPNGFWGKLWAVAYSSCHQISSRSFHVHEHQAPFCARCTGMYLGAGLGLLYLALRGKRMRWPSKGQLAVLAGFLLFFALDGLNSFAQLLPENWRLYSSTNSLRLISGMGMGLAVAAIAVPIFNRALWRYTIDENPLTWRGLILLSAGLGMLGLAVLRGWQPALYFSFVFTPFAFVALVVALYTSLVLIFLRQDGLARNWRELAAPLMLGAILTLLQISVISLLRYAITGTWAPMNL